MVATWSHDTNIQIEEEPSDKKYYLLTVLHWFDLYQGKQLLPLILPANLSGGYWNVSNLSINSISELSRVVLYLSEFLGVLKFTGDSGDRYCKEHLEWKLEK